VAVALVIDMTKACDHMAEDDGMVFCDIGRRVPTECRQMCAAFITDQDPTPARERLWDYHVVGPKQEQAEVATADPIPSS
jgi:hypothetical protein